MSIEPWFSEVAAESGVDFQYVSGASGEFRIPEMMGGGVGLLDFNGDGLLDLFFVQGGSLEASSANQPGNRLFKNLGNGTFQDATETAGIKGNSYGMGCACADFDGDGNTDVYVTNVGPNVLFRNNGDGTFSDVTTEAGVGDSSWGTSSAFLDFNRDGHLDLFVVNYIHWSKEKELRCYSRGGQRDYCSPINYRAPAMDALYRNRGDGTFENVTALSGIDKAFGNGLGVTCADYNNDGWPDIYVANDAMANQLWINRGDGSFTDEALIRGCAVNYLGVAEAGMGVVTTDIQQDGWGDLFVTHLVGEANRLYVNANGYFMDTVTPHGPGAPSWPLTGFGVGFADFNCDGYIDLYVANGRIQYGQQQLDSKDPYAEPDSLLRGLGGGEFEPVIPAGGTAQTLMATGRGLALGDLDNDGDIDVCVVNRDAAPFLLRNVSTPQGNWIMFRVLDQNGVDAIGATIEITVDGVIQRRRVAPNEGYCSSSDHRIHFGLGDATRVDRIKVRWPDNSVREYGSLAPGRVYSLEMKQRSSRD